MSCKHCGAMRRGQGGIEIGGRVTLTMLPGCPCSELIRIPDDVEVTERITFDPLSPGVTVYNKVYLRRFCPALTGTITPIGLDVVCINYPDEDLYITFVMQNYPKSFGTCEPYIIGGSNGFFSWITGLEPFNVPFSTTGGIGQAWIPQFTLDVVQLVEPFDDPPIVDVTYKFSR